MFFHGNVNPDCFIQLLTAVFNYYLFWNEEFEYSLLLLVDGAYQLHKSPSPNAGDTCLKNFAGSKTDARPYGKLVVM